MSEPGPPRAIVTNDDGIDSEGLWRLAAAAAGAGLDVLVAAPVSEASGSSAAMSAYQPGGRVEIQRRLLPGPAAGIPAYAVSASPAFIAYTAARGGFGFTPRLVLAGINRGPNLGRGVLHSGTVGAALTAGAEGVIAAAFSLDVRDWGRDPQWETAAQVAAEVIPVLGDLPGGTIVNVNVPDLACDALAGIRVASLADEGRVSMTVAIGGEDHLRITITEPAEGPEPGTDIAAIAAGFASVTALCGITTAPPEGLPWPVAQAQRATV